MPQVIPPATVENSSFTVCSPPLVCLATRDEQGRALPVLGLIWPFIFLNFMYSEEVGVVVPD